MDICKKKNFSGKLKKLECDLFDLQERRAFFLEMQKFIRKNTQRQLSEESCERSVYHF